jgi:hypothetical protein
MIAGSPGPVEISFNYETDQTRVWKGPFTRDPKFTPKFGVEGYIAIDIS